MNTAPMGFTAPDPEGSPPHLVHPKILEAITAGRLRPDVLEMFYEGLLVYDEETDTIMITHRGREYARKFTEESRKKGTEEDHENHRSP